MTKKIEDKINNLIKEILNYDHHYYNFNESLISDYEYDKKYKMLQKLEQEHPNLIRSFSPTQIVNGFVSKKFVAKEHKNRLYSLQDVFNYDEILKFDRDIKKQLTNPIYSVELKIDGVAIVLTYENGFLKQALTRGNAQIGEDVTSNVYQIKSIPKTIDIKEELEIRGEIYMSRNSFESYNDNVLDIINQGKNKVIELFKQAQKLGFGLNINESEINLDKWVFWLNEIDIFFKQFKVEYKEYKLDISLCRKLLKEPLLSNPRNGASGSIRNLDSNITKQRKLDFLVYGCSLQTYEIFANKTNNSHSKTLDLFVKDFKFQKMNKIQTNDIKQVLDFIEQIKLKREQLEYDIDGIVIKVDNFSFHDQIGFTNKFPKWAIAYKYPPLEKKSILIDVNFQVGRSGVITPVATIKPVFVSGSWISKITLHNKEYIKINNLGLNDIVTIVKSGDVIPQIVKNEKQKNSKEITFPLNCPICNSVLDYEEIKVFCKNNDCFSKVSLKIAHYATRNNMNIESLSVQNAKQLVEYGLCFDVASLYDLTLEQLILLPRWGQKSAQNLLDQLKETKNQDLNHLISALGISNVGTKNATYLAFVFQDLDILIDYVSQDNLFCNYLDDVSSSMLQSLKIYFEKNKKLILKLKKHELNFKLMQKNTFLSDNEKLFKLIKALISFYQLNTQKKLKNKFNDSIYQIENYQEILNSNIIFENKNFTKKLTKLYQEILKKIETEKLLSSNKIEYYLNLVQNQEIKSNFILRDKKVVISGSLENFKRQELTNILTKLGVDVTTSISKNTNYLIYGQKAGSKLKKAQDLNIICLDEQELIKILSKEN